MPFFLVRDRHPGSLLFYPHVMFSFLPYLIPFIPLNSTLTNGKIYNAGDYDANILTYAETLRDNSFTIIRYRGYSSTGESINAAPTNASGAAIIIRTSINYMAIIAIPFDNTGVYSRVKDNGTWKAWTH